ncbi:MAG: TonB-dependent receptor, partial [Asticcacaulis sp.]
AGGASAAYGSDAVSGVVNIITRHVDGFEASGQYGLSEHGDSEEYRLGLAFGTKGFSNRLRFSVAGEITENKGIPDHRDRDWAAVQAYLIPNTSGSGPAEIIATDVHSSVASENGLINAGPLRGIELLAGGGYRNFVYGTNVGPQYMVGGDGRSLQLDATLQVPVERQNLYSILEFDFSEAVTGFAELSYARARSVQDLYYKSDTNLTIQADNAYLPEAVRQLLVDNVQTSFRFGRLHTDFDPYVTDLETETQRTVVGLRGNHGVWSWDAYYQAGRTDYYGYLRNNRIQARFLQAIDVVDHPVSGDLVCRSTLTNPSNGCVPLNIFGSGSPSDQAKAWIQADQWQVNHIDQNVAAFSASGELFNLPAGAVSVAFGAEYREEKIVSQSDAISQAGGFTQGNPKAMKGAYHVREAFAELGVPLLRDQRFARSLDLNLAYRATDYSTSGQVDSWKVGLTWDPVDDLRLRATRSRDVRAPNLNELFAASLLQRWPLLDPLNPDRGSPTTFVYVLGNRDLQPEEADTTTFGVVFQPSFLSGFRASVDYYSIEIDKAITTITPQEIINRCVAGADEFCNYIYRDSDGFISHINNLPVNVNQIETSGVDTELLYRTPLNIRDGHLTLRLLLNYRDKLITTDSKGPVDRAGDAASPHWTWTASSSLKRGPFDWHVEGRYVGGGDYDSTKVVGALDPYTVDDYFYLNTSVQYALINEDSRQLKLIASIKNVFDADPPLVPSGTDSRPITNGALYDLVGRKFTIGFKYTR